jgi:uncharacterized small protein (DUF1192 family)
MALVDEIASLQGEIDRLMLQRLRIEKSKKKGM